MNSPDRSRGNAKRSGEDNSDVRSDRAGDEDEWDGSDRKKHRASRSRKSGNGEDTAEAEGGGRRRSSGERIEARKKSGLSSRTDGDDNDNDSRKESRSKHVRRKQEESALEKLSNWYQDGELENKHDGGNRGHGDRKKMSSKLVDSECAQMKSKSTVEKSYDGDSDKVDKDHRHLEKRESAREKGQGSSDQTRNSRRKWDEADTVKKEDDYSEKGDSKSGRISDPKYESTRERNMSARCESGESKGRGVDSSSDRVTKSNNKEERSAESERERSKGRAESQESNREDRTDKSRHKRAGNAYDTSASWDKSLHADEDGNAHSRDRNAREGTRTSRSKTPEKTSRRHQDSEQHEIDYERSTGPKRKELEKDSYRDDRLKNKDDGWTDRNWDREGSKDGWKRRQFSNYDKDSKSGDNGFDHGREWDFPRHGRDRIDNERPHSRAGNRKDVSRGDAIKTSSNFGFSNENYDVIEIQTKPIDYAQPESALNLSRRADAGRQSDVKSTSNEEEWTPQQDDKAKKIDFNGCETPGDDFKERYMDDATSRGDQNSWRDDFDSYGGKGRDQKGVSSARSTGGQSSGTGSQLQYGNQDSGSFNRGGPQGVKGNRTVRGLRGRPAGRDSQHAIPLPLSGSPFGPFGMPPPGPMQPHNPSMSPAPGPPISPGVFIPAFTPPLWPVPRVLDMNMLAVPPVPHGGLGPRFPNMGNPPNSAMYFNQSGPVRGVAPNMSNPSFNTLGPMAHGTTPDKTLGGWVPSRSGGPPGKAPSRGEQNDYSQNFVDTGMRPQNFIRELELTNVVEDYPKLRELIQKKDEIVANSASAPMYLKCDLKEFELTPEYFGSKFDVILVDPPWEEYVHRAPGVADHMEYWTFEEIMNLKIEAIADTPSFIFLWVGDGVGLEQGRQCLKKWGFRRCEDICWVKTNKSTATPGLRHDSHTLFQHSKEHCLMGIKGTVRRSTDGHIIHANIDTDVIIAEEPPYGSTQKPEDMYRIVEHFALGRRRLELFGEDHNIRAGWLTVGKELSSTNFCPEAYIKNFADKDGKVWQGGGGRNPPPEAPHLVLTTPDIESLRPKSPMKNQQQLQQQQSSSISLTAGNSSSRRPTGNSPQNPNVITINQEGSSSNPSNAAPCGSPIEGFKGRDGVMVPADGLPFDMFGYNGKPNFVDFESQRHEFVVAKRL